MKTIRNYTTINEVYVIGYGWISYKEYINNKYNNEVTIYNVNYIEKNIYPDDKETQHNGQCDIPASEFIKTNEYKQHIINIINPNLQSAIKKVLTLLNVNIPQIVINTEQDIEKYKEMYKNIAGLYKNKKIMLIEGRYNESDITHEIGHYIHDKYFEFKENFGGKWHFKKYENRYLMDI